VFELVTAAKFTGRHYALRMMRQAGVPESKRVGELTERQRVAMGEVLRGWRERLAA
jgi:glucuronate isomerase